MEIEQIGGTWIFIVSIMEAPKETNRNDVISVCMEKKLASQDRQLVQSSYELCGILLGLLQVLEKIM